MRTHSLTAQGVELPPLVSAALERMRTGESLTLATAWTWTWSDVDAHVSVDAWLVTHAHSLAKFAGTREQRFRMLVDMEHDSDHQYACAPAASPDQLEIL